MSKNSILILVTLIVLSFFSYLLLSNKQTAVTTSEPNEEQVTTAADASTLKPAQPQYVDFEEGLLSKLSEQGKKMVLFFYASWCPICQPAHKDILANQTNLPEDIVIVRINYNDNNTDQAEKDLARELNVTYQHTFVYLDNEGKVLKAWNGGKFKELLENIQ